MSCMSNLDLVDDRRLVSNMEQEVRVLDFQLNPFYFSNNKDNFVDETLSKPQNLLPLLFDCEDADLVIFTTDLNRRIRYLGEQSQKVIGLDSKKWEKQNYLLALTEDPANDVLRKNLDARLPPNRIQKISCEIFTDEGNKLSLEVRRRLIVFDGIPLGLIGIAKRAEPLLPAPVRRLDQAHPNFSQLTDSEKMVVELVVNGDMNKTISKKLGIALRTVESRRSRAMSKLGVRTLPELVKLWCQKEGMP